MANLDHLFMEDRFQFTEGYRVTMNHDQSYEGAPLPITSVRSSIAPTLATRYSQLPSPYGPLNGTNIHSFPPNTYGNLNYTNTRYSGHPALQYGPHSPYPRSSLHLGRTPPSSARFLTPSEQMVAAHRLYLESKGGTTSERVEEERFSLKTVRQHTDG